MKGLFRVIALVTVLACLILPAQGFAAAQDLSISVQYTDASGAQMTSFLALPMSEEPGETRFWLTLPADAQWDSLVLFISDLTGQYTVFTPGTGEFLTGVMDAAADPMNYVSIFTYDENGNPGPMLSLYISVQEMPTEETPVLPVEPAPVVVRYLDEQGNPIISDETLLLPEGKQTVQAPSIDGYTVSGQEAYEVTVDENGASVNEIVFYYSRIPVSVDILVRYLDDHYQPLLPDETVTLHEGEQVISCQPIDGYAVVGPESYTVTVNASGASMNEVTFLYSRETVSAAVTVRFVDENGAPLMNDMIYNLDEGTHQVAALEIDGYVVAGDEQYLVTVDQNGASPNELTFRYARRVEPADVKVYYIDDAGNRLAEDEILTLQPGENEVRAKAFDGYVLTTAGTVFVTVDLEGAHPAEIVFAYTREVLPAKVLIHYVDENGVQLAPDTTATVQPGWGAVYPNADISTEDYLLSDPVFYDVYVSADGADPAEVTFVYQRAARAVDIVVRYVNDLGESIAPDQVKTLTPGMHNITPEAIIPEDEYTLMEPFSYQIVVDINGATMNEAVFTYQRLVRPVMVTVHYQDENGQTIAPDTYQTYGEGDHLIQPETQLPAADYTLLEPSSYPLTVTLEGGTQTEVTFTYRRVVNPVDVVIHYVDENGAPVLPDTVETFGEGVWAVFAKTEGLPENYELTGNADGFVSVTVTADGASPAEVTFVYAYREPKAGQVPVFFIDAETGVELADSMLFDVPYGEPVTISAEENPAGLSDDYVLVSSPTVSVSMNADGAVDPAKVVFEYLYVPMVADEPTPEPTEEPTPEPTEEPAPAPTEEPAPDATPSPVTVSVRFVNEYDENVATPVSYWCYPGYSQVLPQPEDLMEGYTLSGPESALVYVDEYGPNPAEVVFTYTQYVPDVPAPKVALVTVKYKDPDGKVFYSYTATCIEGQDNPVVLDMSVVDPALGYELASPDTVFVTVDQNGTPNPAEVEFQFTNEESDYIDIYFVDAATGEFVASPKRELCFVGTNTLDARPDDLKDGYVLDGPSSEIVTLDEYHVLTPSEVYFRYVSNIPATPAPTVAPFDTEMNAYFYPTGNGIRVRSTPSTAEDNIVGLVDPTDVGHILGKLTARDGKGWYSVEIKGMRGYISEGVVRIMSDEEAAALFNFTPVPTQAPAETPAPTPEAPAGEPTPVPQFADSVVDRWGKTNKNVNFRVEPNKSAKRIEELKRNTRLWVYSKEEVDGKLWYHILVNGKEGYVMAEFVDLFSEEESQEVQANLASPMPTQLPLPTEAPTPEPTAEPTPEPTMEPTEEPTPEPTEAPTPEPTFEPTAAPTEAPSQIPFIIPTEAPTPEPTEEPTPEPTEEPTPEPTEEPTAEPTEEPTPEPTAEPTEEPTPEPTAEPTEAPVQATETPAPYRGYALTVGQAALRTGVSQTDDTILQMMPDKSLMYVSGQTYVDGVAWASAQAVGSGNLGFILQSSLTPITSEEARPYLDKIQTTPAATATPSPELVSGPAMTLGDGVPMRSFPDTNGEILTLLPYTAVCDVYSQYYTDNAAWHLVQYNGVWGYIRQDQLRMMSEEEAAAYREKMAGGTPTPTPAPTPEPVSEQSLSSYGHVTSHSGKVNLRSGPSKTSSAIRLLDNYAFALVLGSETTQDGTWYHISQAGTEGYILSDYFHVLSLGELSEFLQSSEYQNANSNSSASNVTSSQIQPVEDYNNTVWQNPALSASYEPFNPFLTPTPDPERLPTDTPVPTLIPTATPEIAPVGPVTSNPPEPTTKEGGSAWPWVLIALAVVGGGGAYYGYTVHRQNEKRRQAARAQQARQARAAAAQPQMRQAQNNPSQQSVNRASYPQQQKPQQSASPFMPPQGGTQRSQQPVQAQQDAAKFRPVTAQQPNQAQQDAAKFQPVNNAQQPAGGTQTFVPIREARNPYAKPASGGRLQLDIKRDPSASPINRPQANAEKNNSAPSGDDLAALAQDVNNPVQNAAQNATQNATQKTAQNAASPLNLNIRVARPGLEEISPAELERMDPQYKRVRRTERNKNLYDQEGPSDQA